MNLCIRWSVLTCSLAVLVSTGATANTVPTQPRVDSAADVSLAAIFVPERVQLADRPRVESASRGVSTRSQSPGVRNAGYSVESNSLTMLLAVVALIGYVIGRRHSARS